MKFRPDALYYGDCLEVMREWPSGSVDLCYLDPPFKSNVDYNLLFSRDSGSIAGGDGAGIAQMVAFEDTWSWDAAARTRVDGIVQAVAHPAHMAIQGLGGILGECGMLAYLSYMAERLAEIGRLLRNTGSVYVHCDPTASHYLKILMDTIFDPGNFRSEIVWKRTSAHSGAKRWGPVHDTILFYTKSDRYTWNRVYQDYDSGYLAKHYRHEDRRGKFRLSDLTGSGTRTGRSGMPWSGHDPTVAGRHWALPGKGSLPGWFVTPNGYSEMTVQERLDVLDGQELIHWPPRGKVPSFKRYLDTMKGTAVQDMVIDINPVSGNEDLGYPTQKPLPLLDRIIGSSSNEGDIVLDPFCGCGTTVESARRLGRRFVGIDISPFAIELVRTRRLKDGRIPVNGIPVDMESARMLARDKPFDFEKWAVTRVPGMAPNQRRTGDGGIDGRGRILDGGIVLAQVKGGKFSVGQLRDFLHVLERERADCGIYLTLDPVQSPNARAEAAAAGNLEIGVSRYPKLQFWSISDFFDNRLPQLPPMTEPYTGKPIQQDLLSLAAARS